MNKAMTQQIDTITRCIVDAVKPEKVILFGSHARSEAGEDSDIDVLVVESEPFGKGRSRLAEIGKMHRALRSIPLPIDILLFSRNEMERYGQAANHVVRRALQEGEIVYERS